MKLLLLPLLIFLFCPAGTWASESGSHGVGITAGYNFANEFNFPVNGINCSYDSTGAPNIGLRYISVPSQGVGFLVGATYDFNRVINSFTVAGVSSPVTGGGNPGMSILTPEADIAFGAHVLYVFAGANYAIPSQTGTWGSGVSFSGSVGFQGGLGFWLGQNFALELLYRNLAININPSSPPNFNTTLAGVGANAAFTF